MVKISLFRQQKRNTKYVACLVCWISSSFKYIMQITSIMILPVKQLYI